MNAGLARAMILCLSAVILLTSRSLVAAAPAVAGQTGSDIVPVIKAGFAEEDITPAGQRDAASGFHDPLKARAAIFDDGHTCIAFVSVDMSVLRSPVLMEQVGAEVQKNCGIPAGNIMFTATHTHASPGISDPAFDMSDSPFSTKKADLSRGNPDTSYRETVTKKIIAAICRAYQIRQEAELAIGSGFENKVSFNRRIKMKSGRAFTQPGKGNPDNLAYAGPIDPEVGVVAAWAKDGKLLGCMVNFACHCTTVSGISADYVYYIEDTIRAGTRSDAVVLFLQGASGDVTNIDNLTTTEKEGGFKYTRKIGVCLGAEALKVMASAERGAHYPIASVNKQLKINFRQPSKERLELAKAYLGSVPEASPGTPEWEPWKSARNYVTLDFMSRKYGGVECDFQALQIGNTVFLSNPSELFCSLGLEIKKQSPFHKTFVVELANGWIGYVPSLDAFGPAGGGYETLITPMSLEIGAGQIIVDTCLELARRLKPGIEPVTPQIQPGEESFGVRVPWAAGVRGPDVN